jgi:hypothetical protein
MARLTGRILIPSLPGLVAAGLVILGVLLSMFVAEGFLALAGLGAFGPGILRELGWLRDQDEFQRQAAHRAGYHAYLIGGLATAFVVSTLRGREGTLEDSSEWVMLILIILWISWLFSALLAYWGARTAASRILMAFGSFWAVFFLAHIVGALRGGEALQLSGVLVGFMLVAPYFALAWTATRWPRRTGVALLAVSALFLVIFGPGGANNVADKLVGAAILLVPLIASGVALLRDQGSGETSGDASGE